MHQCVFCEIVAERAPAHIVYETPHTVAFLDGFRQPTDPAHVLVIPRAHVENLYGIEDTVGAEIFAAHARIARAIKKAFAPDGITTWSSNEPGADQEVPHFHLHVYPRRRGVPFPPKVQQPEPAVAEEILQASAARIRSALGTLRPLRPPPREVLDAFGIAERPTLLGGGRGDSWATARVVLKPVDDPADAAWVAVLADRVTQTGFRLARPVRARSGEWTAEGWAAWERLEGLPRSDRWGDLLAAADAFHAAIASEPKPDFVDRRQDRWRTADRIVWDELGTDDVKDVTDVMRLLSARRPIHLPDQLIHGDLVGNVLFSEGVAPAIIDLSLYWRPRAYSVALVVGDALAWEGAPLSIVDHLRGAPEWEQLLLRAVAFRVIVSELARRAEPWRNDLTDHYRPLVERVLSFVASSRRSATSAT